MQHPFKTGITGGIGSGKSIVSRIIRTIGYPVYDSDTRAKELMETNTEIREKLIKAFGEQSFHNDRINREYLAQRIFQDPADREKINGIVHPVVRADFSNWATAQTSQFVFQESALLIETGGFRLLDATILVVAPLEERIRRVTQRDNALESAIRARIESQMSDSEKLPFADYVIDNSSEQLLIPQVLGVLKELVENHSGGKHDSPFIA